MNKAAGEAPRLCKTSRPWLVWEAHITSPSLVYAHSLADRPQSEWESLRCHLHAVAQTAARFGAAFGWANAAEAAGKLHDIGKVSAAFQAYIRRSSGGGEDALARRGDHSSAGAREAVQLYGGVLGTLLAYGIAGHHAGLSDWEDGLERRLDPHRHKVPAYTGWEEHAGALPSLGDLMSPSWRRGPYRGFSQAFLARMLFSCLVDADSIETRRFYQEVAGERSGHPNKSSVPALLDLLRAAQARPATKPSELNTLRAEVLGHAVSRATLTPGLFTLTVPTGGGKTLTSLRFALEHAAIHDLHRVIYVSPYTSIIEQTAAVFRNVLGDANVLEHHASFDWEAGARVTDDRDDGDSREEPLARLRRAAENWDAPVIVTTAVQFFESLYSARRSRCRKLHNLARSVIVLDETQTLPLPLLQPCLAALDELQRNYAASVILCTATQPAIRVQDHFDGGLDIPDSRELAPSPPALYARLRRVEVEHLPEPVDEAVIVARFGATPQMLCIVNRRQQAASLFQKIREQDGAVHLTTLMCPRHRRVVLGRVRQRLADGSSVRLVATSLIEAGVDIDFPEVWREVAGLDSIAQAAGRCNREGRPELGRVVVFTLEGRPPSYVKLPADVSKGTLRRFAADPLSLDAVRDYFGQLYWNKGPEAFDRAELGGRRGILKAFHEGANGCRFPFDQIARAFRMIDDAMDPVIVPWAGEDDSDPTVQNLLKRIAAMDRPLHDDLRQLQQYTVTVPPQQRAAWLAQGVIQPVHKRLGEALLQVPAATMRELYDPSMGLRLDEQLVQTQF